MDNIIISKGDLEITLCPPDIKTGYYRGTRFDHSGIFLSIIRNGFTYAGQWFDTYDPYKHDAVCGTSEEFRQCGYDEAAPGETFLKPGVGLLVKECDDPYDHFHLYEVADFGTRTEKYTEDTATFIHEINSDKWGYIYEKTVRIIDSETFEIRHSLRNTGKYTIEGDTYNHNFFTFSDARPGPEIKIDFPFQPCGTWRSTYDSVGLTENGVRFSRQLNAGESVFMGNMNTYDEAKVIGKIFSQSGDGHKVTFRCDKAFHHIAFWSNHRVACVEPFIPDSIAPGNTFEWEYLYKLR